MANWMEDIKGWVLLTPEQAAQQAEEDRKYFAELEAEQLARWPMSQRRNRCLSCGCFMRKNAQRYTRCKRCGDSYDSLQ